MPDRLGIFYTAKNKSFWYPMANSTSIDCATACTEGCVQPEQCPGQHHVQEAADFISNTSLEDMHEIAEAARRKKLMAPPQWVIPDWLQ